MKNVEKYTEIMKNYRDGKFGKEDLSVKEILDMAGEPDLIKKMSVEEIQYVIDTSSGFTKMMFSNIKKQREVN